jgi:hypothetical protein
VHDVWDKVMLVKQEWESLVKGHNDEFNPGGVPWKARRPAEVSIDTMPEARAITIPQKEGAPQSKGDLVGQPISAHC